MRTLKNLRFPIVLFTFASLLFSSENNLKLSSTLRQKLKQSHIESPISCLVFMTEKYGYSAIEGYTIKEKIDYFKRTSQRSQQSLRRWIAKRSELITIHKSFWVFNGLHITALPSVITQLSQRPDVSYCTDDVQCVREKVEVNRLATTPAAGVAWGVRKVGADKCWELGYTGKGVVVGVIDGGVQYEHPAFEGKWTGYWIPTTGCDPSPTPYDMNGHGSHCLGSIIGGDGPGPMIEDIGVAPGAKYAAAATKLKTSQCMEALEYMAGLSDSCNIRVVSSSWTSGANPTDAPKYIDICNTMMALNIMNVFCNGNVPTQRPGSVWLCGSLPNVIGVGNVDSTDKLNPSSALGPASSHANWSNKKDWLRSDWNFIKPNITAPGTDIWSCSRTSGYIYKTGTSMATPHVAGAIALLCEKNPNLKPKEIYDILINSADQPIATGPYPNNNFGWGRLNVYKAIQNTPIAQKKVSMTKGKIQHSFNSLSKHVSIVLNLKKSSPIYFSLHDAQGRLLVQTIKSWVDPGHHQITQSVKSLPAGLYLITVQTNDNQYKGKFILVSP